MFNYKGNPVFTPYYGYDRNVKSIAHRGFSSVAPENTLPSYILAKKKGFYYVETDISFTSDGVPVLLHDATIDRTSDGSGNIGSLTWDQVQQYDFGSWKSAGYAGTKIPSFAQFLNLCRNIQLHPYIELKQNGSYTEAQVQSLVDMVNAHGLRGKVTWISFSFGYLGYVKAYDPDARLGLLGDPMNAQLITNAVSLRTGTNDVFIDARDTSATATNISACLAEKMPLEVWTIDSADTVIALDPYVTGVTSNSLIAGQILLQYSI